jgi:plastocyanin
MTRRLFLLLLTVLALTLGVAACGGDDDEGSADTTAGGGGGTTLMLMADPSGALKYEPDTLTAPAGEVTIQFMNESGLDHNVEVEGNGVEEVSDTISEGSTSLTLTLEPGEYEFYCTIDGHKDAGMEGTLTVE